MSTAFAPDPNRWYVLTFAHSGLALSTATLTKNDGVAVCQAHYERLGNQQWRFKQVEGDWYSIHPRFGGKSIKVYKSETTNRARVHLWGQASGDVPLNEQWRIEPQEAGGYLFRARHSNKVLDLQAASPVPGALVIQYAAAGNANQRLHIAELPATEEFTPEPGAWYTLRMAHSGLVLDVKSNADANGATVWQYPEHGNYNQQWGFEEAAPGWYFIRPRYTDRVLDVHASSTADGTTIYLWTKHGGPNQQWKIEPWSGGYRLRCRATNGLVAIAGGSLDPTGLSQLQAGGQQTCVRIEYAADPVPDLLLGQTLSVSSFTTPLRLPLIRAFGHTRETTIEAWMVPRSATGPETLIDVGERGSRFTLEREGEKLFVRLYRSDRIHTLCEASTVQTNCWTHVCVTVRHDNKNNRYDLELFVNGTRVTTGRTGKQSSKDGREVFASGVQSEVAIGSEYGGKRRFGGELAEVRFWSVRRSSEAIAADYRKRMRGDEDTLAACYPFERVDEAGRICDVSVNRLHIEPSSAGLSVNIGNLPVPPLTGPVGRIDVEGQLYTECFDEQMLHVYALANLTTIANVDESESPTLSIDDVGTRHQDGLVELNLFDALLTPRSSDGSALPDQLMQLWLVRPQVVIVDNPDGSSHTKLWAAGRHLVRSGSDGSLALRFVALTCEGPVLYARFASMANGTWTPVHADVGLYARMHELTGAELLSPSNGRPSPLPSGTSEDAADVLADMLAGLAWAGSPPENQAATVQTRGLLNTISGWFKQLGDAAVDLGEVNWKPSKPVGELLGAASDLANKAADQVPGIGKRAIIRRIAEADEVGLVLEQASSVRPVVLLVGRVGSSYWRVLVTTIEDAAAAIWSVFKRVGASVKHLLSILAGLFDWAEFLAESDSIYDSVVGSVTDIRERIGAQGSVRERIAPHLEPGPDSPNFDLSIDEWIAKVGKPPKLHELDRVLRYARRIFSSPKLGFELSSALTLDFGGVDLAAFARSISGAIPAMAYSPSQLFGSPARPIFELPATVWSEVADAVDPICNALFDASDAMFGAVEGLLTKRMVVPLLTKLIETTILSADGTQRKLNLLRLFALAAAIPTIRATASSSDTATSSDTASSSDTTSPQVSNRTMSTMNVEEDSDSEQTKEENHAVAYRNLSKASAGLGIANWVLWSLRAAADTNETTAKLGNSLAQVQVVTLIATSYVESRRAYAAGTVKPEQALAINISSVLNGIDACCCATAGIQPLETVGDWVGSYGVGAVWITNAAVFAGEQALNWEISYWICTWFLGGVGKTLRRAAKDLKRGSAKRRKAQRNAIRAFSLNTALNVTYLTRAIVKAS